MIVQVEEKHGEIWTGAIDQLPATRPDSEVFATPTSRLDEEHGVAIVDIIGLVDHGGWLKTAVAISEAAASGARGILLSISSKAQEVRGCGLAFDAIETAGKKLVTTAHCYDAGGAAFALAQLCQKVTVEPDHLVGWGSAKSLYGVDVCEPNPDHVALLIGALCKKRMIGESSLNCPAIAAALVNSGAIAQSEMTSVLKLFTDTEL